jgi:putative thioredoxin
LATLGLSEADRAAVETFQREVVEPSMARLILVDFATDRSPASKALSPVIEKVAADYAGKGVGLVRIDADANRFIVAQFQLRTIPAVYAIFQGQPVADLSPARTEGQLKQMLDQLLAQLPIEGEARQLEARVEPLIEMGESLLTEGDAPRAANIFRQIVEMAPDHPAAVAGLARALLASGDAAEAKAALDALPETAAKDPAVARARSALALAEVAPAAADTGALEARIAADPDDLAARYDLAGALIGAGARDAAADQLLDIVRRDRDWNEGAARARLLQMLEAVGLEDPWAAARRRRLSEILFG